MKLVDHERRAMRLAAAAQALGVTGKNPRVEDPGVSLWDVY